MNTVVFFLEEPSAREMLEGILPRLFPVNIASRFLVFRGKQDLEKNLKQKLQAWRLPKSMFVVMRDQDNGDCRKIKSSLLKLCDASGRQGVLIRIACKELESFYLGDLSAVEKGLGLKGLRRKQNSRKFRDPDKLENPSEELFRLTRNVYDKVIGSRAISPHLCLTSNRSKSFMTLVNGIKMLVDNIIAQEKTANDA